MTQTQQTQTRTQRAEAYRAAAAEAAAANPSTGATEAAAAHYSALAAEAEAAAAAVAEEPAERVRVTRAGHVMRGAETLGYVGKYDDTGVSDYPTRGWLARSVHEADPVLNYRTRAAAVAHVVDQDQEHRDYLDTLRAEAAADNAESNGRLAECATSSHRRRVAAGSPVRIPRVTFHAAERDAREAAAVAAGIARTLRARDAHGWDAAAYRAADRANAVVADIVRRAAEAAAEAEAAGYDADGNPPVSAEEYLQRAEAAAERAAAAEAAGDPGAAAWRVVEALNYANGERVIDAERAAAEAAAAAADAPFTCSQCGDQYGGYAPGVCGDCDPLRDRSHDDDDDTPAPGWDAI